MSAPWLQGTTAVQISLLLPYLCRVTKQTLSKIFTFRRLKSTIYTSEGLSIKNTQYQMSDLPPPTSRRLTGVHFKSYVWPQILSYESVSLCKLCLLFFGPMNTSAICQFEKLCTFHLFAERGVQSGRDRGYVRARRQPSSFLGDENETYTKIIEEMASFQLYSFVSPHLTYVCCRLSFFFLRQAAYAIAHAGGKVPASASSQSIQTLSFFLHLSQNESY